MGKLYLKYEFDTENPDDMFQHNVLVNAFKHRSLLYEIYNEFRNKNKYTDPDKDPGSWAEAYDKLWILATDEDINPWDDLF